MKLLLSDTYEMRAAQFAEEANLMQQLASGQHPQVLYIGCADSRIVPSRILGAKPGDVFVMRNVANIVPPANSTDCAVGAVIEYAVRHLHIPHIVICGHTLCGGIQNLHKPHNEAEPFLSRWLDYARPAQDQIPEDVTEERRLDAIIEANVLLQIAHLRTYPCVREAEATGQLQLHAWVYDFRYGRVRSYDDATGTFVEELPASNPS
ncbi:MAG: carbonic anhydrase [Anaerolineae bacterium]|nr:carbonic anhydrase [Anaerolineae bacterium]